MRIKSAPTAKRVGQILKKEYANFAVVHDLESSNRHHRQCKRLGLPFVAARFSGEYADVDIDFHVIEFDMCEELDRQLRNDFVERYWRSKPAADVPKIPCAGDGCYFGFRVLAKDLYPIAERLMPLINNRSNWVAL